MKPSFRRIAIESVDWTELDVFPDRMVYQTLPWVNFIADGQNAEPVIAGLWESGEVLGYFTGLIINKFGFRILGSPFPGWSTTYMGFNLKPGVTRASATESLIDFAFGELKCHHIELMDRQMTPQDYQHLGFETLMFGSYELDLRPSLEQIFAGMSQNARNEIRRAQKEGITVEEAHDVQFADDYYEQLKHVFAVKNSVPPFKVDRIRQLIKFMEPTGNLLMLRALNSEGTCIATGIDVGFNETVFGWGRASWRHHSRFRPNELLYWHSIRFWKAKGASLYDLTGEGANKRKFGSNKILVPWIRKSRWRSLALIRSVAQDLFWWAQHAAGKAAHVLEGLKRRTVPCCDHQQE